MSTSVSGGYTWTLNGKALPRNPDSVEWQLTKANVAYETMLDGSYRRLSLPGKFSGRDLKLGWKMADQRLRNAVFAALISNAQNTLIIGGTAPLRQLNFYADDLLRDQVSDQVFDPRAGQGGMRRDIQIAGVSEPFFRSASTIPSGTPTVATVNANFGGPTGDYTVDGLIAWNGNPWVNTLSAASQSFAMTNMGTAPWAGVIRINGPFNSAFTLNVKYLDVDGSGQGVTFTWTGSAIASGNYVLFDTQAGRVYQVVGGTKTEVYTFSITAQSNGAPVAQWPAVPPLSNFTAYTSAAGYGAGSSLDYTNNATEQFRYV